MRRAQGRFRNDRDLATFSIEAVSNAVSDVVMQGVVVGRNQPCPCGSGRRYKECHGGLDNTRPEQPQSADGWHSLGVAALERGDFAAATALIEKAIALNSARAAFHRDLARAC